MASRLPPPRRDKIPWRTVGVVAVIVGVAACVYYYFYGRRYSTEQARIIKDRRALDAQIAVPYDGIRARVEKWTVALATSNYDGDYVDEAAKSMAWRARPSLYLRLRAADATTPEAVHAASKVGAFDGLSSCLLQVEGGKGPWTYGETVARAEMLGSAFMKQVSEASELELRNLAYGLDYYKEHDFPPLKDAVTLAEYVIVAIDEDAGGAPPTEDGGVDPRLAVAHPIRLAVWRLADDKQLLRVRRVADAGVVQVQGDPILSAGAATLRQAQAIGCAMAGSAIEAAGGHGLPAMNQLPSPTPTALPPSPSTSTSAPSAPSTSTSASSPLPSPPPSTSASSSK